MARGPREAKDWHRIPAEYADDVQNFRAEINSACKFHCCGKKRIPFYTFYIKKQWRACYAYIETINNTLLFLLTVISTAVASSATEEKGSEGFAVFVGIAGFFSTILGHTLLNWWYGYNCYGNPLQWYIARKSPDHTFKAKLTSQRELFDEKRDRMEILRSGRLTRSPLHGVRIVGIGVRLSNDVILLVIALFAGLALGLLYLIEHLLIWIGQKRDLRKERIAAAKLDTQDSALASSNARLQADTGEISNRNEGSENGSNVGNSVNGDSGSSGSDEDGASDRETTDAADSASCGDEEYAEDQEQSSRIVEAPPEEARERSVSELNESVEVDQQGFVSDDDGESEEESDVGGLIAATTGLTIFCISANQIIDFCFDWSGLVGSIGGGILWGCIFASQDFAHINGNFNSDAVLAILKLSATTALYANEVYYEALLFRRSIGSILCGMFKEATGDSWMSELINDDVFEVYAEGRDVFDEQDVDDMEIDGAVIENKRIASTDVDRTRYRDEEGCVVVRTTETITYTDGSQRIRVTREVYGEEDDNHEDDQEDTNDEQC